MLSRSGHGEPEHEQLAVACIRMRLGDHHAVHAGCRRGRGVGGSSVAVSPDFSTVSKITTRVGHTELNTSDEQRGSGKHRFPEPL